MTRLHACTECGAETHMWDHRDWNVLDGRGVWRGMRVEWQAVAAGEARRLAEGSDVLVGCL